MSALTEEEARVVEFVNETPHHLLNAPKFLPVLLAIVRRLDEKCGYLDERCDLYHSRYTAYEKGNSELIEQRNSARREASRWRAAYFNTHKNNDLLWTIGVETLEQFESAEPFSWELKVT